MELGTAAIARNATETTVGMPLNAPATETKNEIALPSIEKICMAITTLTTEQRDRPDVPSEFPIRIAGLASSIMRNITVELNRHAAANTGVPHSLILASAAISLHAIVQASLQPPISMPHARTGPDSKASSASEPTTCGDAAANECVLAAAEFFNLLPTTLCAKSLKWHSDGRAAFYILQSGFNVIRVGAAAAIRWGNAVALLIATGICGDDDKSYFRAATATATSTSAASSSSSSQQDMGSDIFLKAGSRGIDVFVRALSAKLRLEQIKKDSVRQKEELNCVNELVRLGVPSDPKISALSWATRVAWHFISRFAPHDPIRQALMQLFTRVLELIDGKKKSVASKKKESIDFPLQPTTVPIFKHMLQLLDFCEGRAPLWTKSLGSRVDVVECAPAIYASRAWFQRSFESEAVWRLSMLNEAGRADILSKAAESERVLAMLRRQEEEEHAKSISEMTKATASAAATVNAAATANAAMTSSGKAKASTSKAVSSSSAKGKAAPSKPKVLATPIATKTASPIPYIQPAATEGSKAGATTDNAAAARITSPAPVSPIFSSPPSTTMKGKGTTSKKSAVISTPNKRSRIAELAETAASVKPTRKPKTKTGALKTTPAHLKVDDDSSMSDEVKPPPPPPLVATASMLSVFGTLPGPTEPPLPPFPTALIPIPSATAPIPTATSQSAVATATAVPVPLLSLAVPPLPALTPATDFASTVPAFVVPLPSQSKLNAGRISVWTGPVTSLNCGQFQNNSIVKEIIEARRNEWETLTHVPTTAADITQCVEWHLLGGNSISESIGTDTMRIQPAIFQTFCTWTLAYLRQGVIPTRDALLIGPSLRATFAKLFKWFMLQFSNVLSPAIAALGCTLLVHMADSETKEDADDYRIITDILTAREHDIPVGEHSVVPVLRDSRWVGCPFSRLQPSPTASDSTLDRHGWAATLMLYIINTSRLFETEKEDASTTVSDRYSHEYRLPGTGRYRWYELGVQVAGRIMGMMLLELTDATNLPQSKLLALPMRPDARARVEAHVESEYAKAGLAVPPTRSLALATASKSSSKSAQMFGSLTTEIQEAYATIVRRVLARLIGSAREKQKYEYFFKNVAKRLLMGSAEDAIGPRRVITLAPVEVKTSNEGWTSPANSAEEERFDSVYWCFSMMEAIKLMTAIDIGPKADRMAREVVRAQRNYKIYDAGLEHHRKRPCPPNDTDPPTQRLATEVANSAICQHKLERLEKASLALLPPPTSSDKTEMSADSASKVESKVEAKGSLTQEANLELMSDKSDPPDTHTVNITRMSDAGPLPAIPNG